MNQREYAAWREVGGRSVPCYDCTAEYAAEMRDIGRCYTMHHGQPIPGEPGISPWTNPATRHLYNSISARAYRERKKVAA